MNQKQTEARLQQLAFEASAIYDGATAEGRELTPAEREQAAAKVRQYKDLQARQAVLGVAGQIGTPGITGTTGGDGRPLAPTDAGRAFVSEDGIFSRCGGRRKRG
jgi:hypothetical protein